MSQQHILKCWPVYFDAIERGDKNFEVRKDDRAYEIGDVLILQKYNPERGYVWDKNTGGYPPQLRRRITYIFPGGKFGVELGYVVMALGIEFPDEQDDGELPEQGYEGGA